ncbi:MAG: DUF4331 family protein [Byssovorax sp.]
MNTAEATRRTPRRKVTLITAFTAAGALALALCAGPIFASDHQEAPGTQADPAADITDLYVWHDQDRLIAAINFNSSMPAAGQTGGYDASVLYSLHIDTTGDGVADSRVNVRFGKNKKGEWGVKVEGLPGATAPVIGPVETPIDAGGGRKVFAGLRDDPFFIDLEGLGETLGTSKLSIDKTRDAKAGLNVTSIVIEMDLAAVKGNSSKVQVWATTGRKGG